MGFIQILIKGFALFVCTSWIFCNLLIRTVLFTLLNEIVCARKTTNLQTTTYKVLWKRSLVAETSCRPGLRPGRSRDQCSVSTNQRPAEAAGWRRRWESDTEGRSVLVIECRSGAGHVCAGLWCFEQCKEYFWCLSWVGGRWDYSSGVLNRNLNGIYMTASLKLRREAAPCLDGRNQRSVSQGRTQRFPPPPSWCVAA